MILIILIIIFHMYRYGNAKTYSICKNTKLSKKIISTQISEDIEPKDVWSRSREMNKFFYALDSPRKDTGYIPDPPKPTTSVVSIEDCDETCTSHSQHNGETSKIKKLRAKSHIPRSGITKIRLSEFTLLRKTEPNLPSHSELTSSLVVEEDEL